MTTLTLEDFKLGLDVRKSILTAEPGSLRVLDNCVVTAGGEIEKRKAFVLLAGVSGAVTHGLHGTSTGDDRVRNVFVFGQGAGPPTTTTLASVICPDGSTISVVKITLGPTPDYPTFSSILDVTEYGSGQFFVAGVNSLAADGSGPFGLVNWWQGNQILNYQGAAPLVAGQKMYRVAGSVLYFSGVGDPSVTNPLNLAGTGPNTINPGAGFIDLSRIDSDATDLIGMEAYYKQVGIFSRRVCILYSLDPSPANNVVQQVLRIGAVSNGSILQFGTGDVLFLSDNGVRSLRVLNASYAAGVTDVGSPIDSIIQAALGDPNNASRVRLASAIVDPISGRYWLALGNKIYVLSYWPSSKISAWSTFTLPFPVDAIATAGTRVFLRSGSNVYIYGGVDGHTYDNCVATVQTPFMSAGRPTVFKQGISIDAMIQGTWNISVGMQTDNPALYELLATVTGDTYSMRQLPFAGYGTHISFTLTTSDAAPALLGSITAQFQKADGE